MADECLTGHDAIVFRSRPQTSPPDFKPLLSALRCTFVDLYLVRHGQPEWAPGGRATNDPDLSPLGREQAERLGSRIDAVGPVDELWVSPMRRAQETADPIESGLGVARETYDWLHEITNPPSWEGEPVDRVERALRDANLREMDEMWDGLPGGESFRDFHERVVQGLIATLDAHGIHPSRDDRTLWQVDDPDQRVVIVAHGGTNAVVLGHLLGLDPVPWEWDRFQHPHSGVSRLTMFRVSTSWAFSLRQMGDVAHLGPEMVTR